jgi:hypothetical protein
MLRTLVIASMMLAAGPALAEMAAPAPIPPHHTTVRGCTSSGYSGCVLLRVGKENILLTAKAGVVLPPANTRIFATGTLGAAPPNVCNATRQLTADKIIQTKGRCK